MDTHQSRGHNNWRRSSNNNHNKTHNEYSKRIATTNQQATLNCNSSSQSASGLNYGSPHSLLDLSSKIVAEHIPFQSIEQRYEHIPEPVQRRIIFWSFPRQEEDIKMYSSLSSDTFNANGPMSSLMSSASQGPSSNNTTQQSPSSNSNNNSAFPAWIADNQQQPSQAAANTSSSSSSTSSSLSKAGTGGQRKQLTFHKGLRLYNEGCVQDVLQVGFNLSGLVLIKSTSNNQTTGNSKIRGNSNYSGSSINSNINSINNNLHHHLNNNLPLNVHNNNDVINNNNQQAAQPASNLDSALAVSGSTSTKSYRVSVTFDRCKITSVSCSCGLQDIFWCEHAVAIILYRIRNPGTIDLRVPISETLLSLDRQQLQKLVQYIIAEHHTEVLPTAQRLLDEMRQSYSKINQIHGAPDPTAGACADDEHIWHLDEQQVNEKVQNYLNLVCSNSKDASKQINALFEKIREMFRAKDSNGTRLLKLITEQFLQYATRNEKSRSLWDQLAFLWVVVMLNPDLTKSDRKNFVQLLLNWSKVAKCPKEDFERRIVQKRKTAEVSDDEDSNELPNGHLCPEHPTYNRSNIIPAHSANHRTQALLPNVNSPLRQFNLPLSLPPPPCNCPPSKRAKVHDESPRHHDLPGPFRPSTSSIRHQALPRPSCAPGNLAENRPPTIQEPRSVFFRALDFQDSSWDDPHLQLILSKDGPVSYDLNRSYLDFAGNPLWDEPVSQAAARVETLRSHGYREQALRLTIATVRNLKVQQEQWCLASSPDLQDSSSYFNSLDINIEGWIGHPFDPVNVVVDLLLESSLTEMNNTPSTSGQTSSAMCPTRCSCPYNQALAYFTHRLLPDLATLSYQHRIDGFPILPLVDLTPRRPPVHPHQHQNASDKTPFYHVSVPGCCQKDSYLTLAVETALIALGQQRPIPTITTAHDRAVRQEAELISKLESIDTHDPLLMEILKRQTNLLLGTIKRSNGISTDSAPLHTFVRYLFDSLVSHFPQLAYKVGVETLKMPLLTDENGENFGAARTSPRSINYNHLQSEQLALAQAMLSRAKDEPHTENFMRRVYRASIRTIRNPASLLKLSKHALKEAKPSGIMIYRTLLETAFDLGLHVLRITKEGHNSNTRFRREAMTFIVECATDLGLDWVFKVMRNSRDHLSPTEALSLVVCKDTGHINLRAQAISKLKLKEHPSNESDLSRVSRELVLVCANLDPKECALDALKFCETHAESLKKALKIITDAGINGTMKSAQLIEVADHIHERGMTDKAFEIAMVAIGSMSTPSNADNGVKNDIFRSCEYAQKVNGFSILIPKLINNIDCAIVLSEIYHRFSPSAPAQPAYKAYGTDVLGYGRGSLNYTNKEYNDILTSLNPDIYKQRVEDAYWWDALLKHAQKAFVHTTRTRLQNISPRHYGEFIDFLVKAQSTFEKATDGPQQFKDLISEIMKSYRTKKKLMERLKARFDYPIKVCV